MTKIHQLSDQWFNDHWWWYLSIFILITATAICLYHTWGPAKYENVKWYVRHTYGMNWKWRNLYNFHFYINYHLKLYVFSIQKEFHWNRCSISVAPMASNMYFIQWIMTSYYQKGYKLYRNYSMWIKIACIQSCSQILSRFDWCCKIQLCCESTNVKLMWSHQLKN